MLDEEGNIIFPNEFIPIAERFGFMSQIDRWVMKNALKTLEEHPNIHIFINLSGVSLGDKALLSFIEKSLEDSTIDPARLGFEITETAAIRDLPQSRTWIKRIKLLGCKFALDDFGVGFSSFSYLSDLPVDYLKIDGSFVRDLDKDPTQKALIRAINALAHELGKETIAEFVENQAILMILQDLRVDCCQGYYIGTPKLLDANLCIYKENVNSRREMECG
jgi:EAL domain-containing protein (putative c-di-GMP-specific phosphodiesterase class I)